MDFNALIADLNTSIDSLTKECATRTSFNSLYCRKVSKVVDQIASNSEYSNVITGLWCVAENVVAHMKYLRPIHTFSQLCLKIFRQCAKVILNIQWQNLEEDSSLRQNFLASLKNLHAKLVPLSITLLHPLEGLAEDPWTHPILAKIMGGEIDDSNHEEVHSYIEDEDPIILQLRVDMMLKENCEEFALNLCNSYLSHPKLQSDLNIRKTQLSLLYKLGQEDKLQEECKKLTIQDAVQVIKLLQTARTHKKMCTVLTQTFMVQNWIRPSDVEASKELLRLWIGHQLVVDKDEDQFKESVWAVAKLSQATEQIALLIDVLRQECGDSFLQLFVDMCIFAINVDKGQMEANRNEGNREAAAARRSDMASICDKLSCLCHHISIKVARICALTAFALQPTEGSFRKIGALYGQGGGQFDQSPSGENQSPGVVNPATLYEVERLLNMLRPGYLNPDQLFTNIEILCRRYLQECLKKVEEFQKVRCSSQSSSNASSATTPQIETSQESASSTTSYMSTVLAESLSSEDVQDIQLLLNKMRLLDIGHPKTPLQDLGTSTPKLPSLPRSVHFDHSYQTTKNIPNILEMNIPYMLGAKKVSIKQEHQHNLVKEGDRTQQKGNRCDEQPQTISVNQPLNPDLTHQPLQQSKQLNEIILAALKQDSAALFKLAQSSSPETIQTAISIIKSKLQNSSVPVSDQQQKSTSLQSNNTVSFIGAQPTFSAHLEPANDLQQRQSQLHLQIIQDGMRGHSSHAQSSRPHLYNQQVVTSACNSLPHFQVQPIRAQAPNFRSFMSPSSLTMDSGKQVTANSVAVHSVNTATSVSSTTSGSLSQEKLKAESLLLAKSCVGEIRHFLQSQLLDSQQKQIREAPKIAGSAVTLPGVSIVSTSAGAEYSSSSRLQSAAALAKRATVSKIQENFSQNILYQIQQHISKQDQTGVPVNGRPYALSIIQPQSLYQPQQQHDNSKNSQQTISNLLVPSSIGVSKLSVSNGKSSVVPVPHSVLQTLKPHVLGSVMPSVTNATHKPQSSSLVVIKQPKIISFSNLPNMPAQQPVIEVNNCSALYVTTCPVSCINNISQSSLNNCNPFTLHTSAKPNTVSQSNLNNKQIQPLSQNILPNLSTVTGLSLSNQQPSLAVPNILSNVASKSSLINRSSKPLYQKILPNVNTTAVSTLNNQKSHSVIQHILPNMSPQSSLNNRQSTSVAQNSLPKLHTITVQSSNNLQTSDSVQHVFTKPNISTLPTLDNKQPKPIVRNSCSKYGEEIPKGQQFEVILANAASVRPKENITVQKYEAAKSNDTVYYSQSLMQSKTISDKSCADASNNALYRCIICGIAFKTLDDLRHHVKFVCKPEKQSSSSFSTKFKQNKASAPDAGVEATTVFQCLRCLELCISQAGIKQHRLICNRVPQKPSHSKRVTDSKEKETLPVTACYNSSSIAGDDNCNNRQSQSESKENSGTEFSSKTGDNCGGNSVSTVSIDTSCQLTVSDQLKDSMDKQEVANVHGIKQPWSVSSESLGCCEPKSISNQETANYMATNTLLTSESDNTFSKEIVVASAVNQHESKQPGSSDQINMFSIQSVTDMQINNLVNTESRSISSEQTVNNAQTSSSLNTEPGILSRQQVMNDIKASSSLNPESGTISSHKVVSGVQTVSSLNIETLIIPSQSVVSDVQTSNLSQTQSGTISSQQLVSDIQSSSSLNPESETISSQQLVSDVQSSSSLNPESGTISSQQLVSDVQSSSSLNPESGTISSQQLVSDVQSSSSLNPESGTISSQQLVSDVQSSSSLNPESGTISSQQLVSDVQSSSSLNPESETISSQQLVSDVQSSSSLNPESGTISSQQLVSDVQSSSSLNPESETISSQQLVSDVQTSSSLNPESGTISSQQLVSDVQSSSSLNPESGTISSQQLVSDVQSSSSLNPESETISSQQLVSDVQLSNTESSSGLHNIPEPTSQSESEVPLKSECAILPGQVPGTSNISKTLAAFTSGIETDKCNLVTFQPNIIRPATINNSENLPPLSSALPDYSNMSQNSVAAVIANAAYQMPLNVAFMNSSSVTAKENTLFPLSKLCLSINDATTNKNIGNDNLIDTSPRKRALQNTKVMPGAACPDLLESGAGKFVICGACSKVVSTTSSFRVHLEMCTMRNTTETRIRALQEKVQNAEYSRDDVCSGLMRVVENVAGGDGDALKVVNVDCVKSSVVPMMQVCTDEVMRNSSKNADSAMQISILQKNAGCDGSSQGDIKEFKSNIMAIANEAENKTRIDALNFMGESYKIKKVVVNESIDSDLVTKTFPEIIDTEGRSCEIKNEAHLLTNCVEEAVKLVEIKNEAHVLTNCIEGTMKSVKTKEKVNDVRYRKEGNRNSRTVVNSGKDSLFCKICQVLYRSKRILLQHFIVKHLKPYTIKASNSSFSYICHFCRNSFTAFKQYMQHMPHHSVIVNKKIKSFQSAKTSQNSQRNAMQKKATKKHNVSKNVTVTMKNRKTASISAASRRKGQLLAVKTKSFLDKWSVSRSLCHNCVAADKDCNRNEADHTVIKRKPETKCLINNNSVNHDESCCQVVMNAHHSPEYARDNCSQELRQGDQIVGDTCDRSSRNMRDLPVTRRRKAAMNNHGRFSKQRRISEVTETRERDLEHGTLEKRAPSDQSECYTHPDCPVNRNPVTADHQLTQVENSDLLKDLNEASEPRKNSSIRFSQRLRKKLQPDVAHSESVKTLLCSKDLEATPSCNNSTITADKLQLTVVKDTKHSASKSHIDVTIRPPSCMAPNTMKPSFLDSYLSYISNYPLSEATTITTKEK